VPETRTGRIWPLLISVLAVVALLVLPLQAVADVWRAPALLPQHVGTRGIAWLMAPGARVAAAVTTSLVVALVATTIGLVVAWPAARALSRLEVRSRTALLAVIAAPLLVPGFAIGTGMATWLLRLGLADTLGGLVAAHLVFVLPYAVLVLVPAFDDELRRLEEAARTAGAGPVARVRLVTVPAVARPLAVAALLGFVVSWSQYGTSLAVGGGRLTLPIVLLPFIGRDPQLAAVLSLVFLVPPLLALVAVHTSWQRR
jgi:putative spermidine/putrescine transport system permease protein